MAIVKTPVKATAKLRHERTRIPNCYTILLPPKKIDALQRLEDSYKKIVTNNEMVKPIKVILASNEEYNFQLPIELKAFILGITLGGTKWP